METERNMRLTLIQACVGRRAGQKYVKSWQMEPLPLAVIAGLTPPEVEIAFHDDRMEPIPYEKPTDLVAIAVETYTAKRAYQIASEYRRRGVPVVMGGFHATLCPAEVSQYAESVVIGEAEELWEKVLHDAERGSLQPYYWSDQRPVLTGSRPDRKLYAGKKYLPLGLVESSRGCQLPCDFCAIQSFFHNSQNSHPLDEIVSQVRKVKGKLLIFFVDDNFAVNRDHAKKLLQALIPLNIRWVSQASVSIAHDEELLQLMAASGCQGMLIGLESLNPESLTRMNKSFNLVKGGFEAALANLRRHDIRVYATFVFGYDDDTQESFEQTLRFATDHSFFLAAFNHLVPFPGTPLYRRLEQEGRLLYDKWWLNDRYGFYMVPFRPAQMTPEELERGCIEARTAFYRWRSIWQRSLSRGNRTNPIVALAYYWINYQFQREVSLRTHYPLGDEGWTGELIKVRQAPHPLPAAVPTV